MCTDPKTRRRFPRFNLRAMLLLVLVIAAALKWTLYKVQEQGIAVAALEKWECSIGYADNKPPTILERLRMWCGEKQYRNAVGVGGDNSQLTDAGLVHIERLMQLTVLGLTGTQITDAGLAHLERLTQLQVLELNDTQVTDAGLAHLERLTQLQMLDLQGTLVTDAGFEKLQKALPNLDIRWLPGWSSKDSPTIQDEPAE